MNLMFTKKEIPYPHYEFLNQESSDRIRVIPERGGLLSEWRCNGREILYFDQDRFLQESKSVRGGIPILFPICGNLSKDILVLPKGNCYLKQHGFARDQKWEMDFLDTKNGFKLKLNDNINTRQIFPYLFGLEIQVSIQNNALFYKTKITNKDIMEMPFCFGLHPYFNLSNPKEIKIQGLDTFCVNNADGKKLVAHQELGRLHQGVDLTFSPTNEIKVIDLLGKYSIKLNFESPMDLPVIWTDPPRNMICVEPWTSPRNSLITGERKLVLSPGETKELNCSFEYMQF